jgi:hypothetical protein
MSLLETAHGFEPNNSTKSTKKHNPEEVEELAIAWLRGEVTYTQACKALKTTGSSAYGMLGVAIRRAIIRKKIKVTFLV